MVDSESSGDKPQHEADLHGDYLLPQELIARIPADVRGDVQRTFAALVQYAPAHPLAQKIEPQHIEMAIKAADASEERIVRYYSTNRWFLLVAFLVVASLMVFVLVYFKEQPNVFGPILGALGGFLAGFGSGIGYAKRTD